jgi:Holliday junction resolvase
MAINSKKKGKEGELELAHKLKEYGYDAKRSVQYNGKDGQADVLGLPHIHIECKRVEKLNIYDAIAQAKRDAKNDDKPAVFHRKNRSNWLVTMELDSFMELYAGYIDNGKLIKALEKKIAEYEELVKNGRC